MGGLVFSGRYSLPLGAAHNQQQTTNQPTQEKTNSAHTPFVFFFGLIYWFLLKKE